MVKRQKGREAFPLAGSMTTAAGSGYFMSSFVGADPGLHAWHFAVGIWIGALCGLLCALVREHRLHPRYDTRGRYAKLGEVLQQVAIGAFAGLLGTLFPWIGN